MAAGISFCHAGANTVRAGTGDKHIQIEHANIMVDARRAGVTLVASWGGDDELADILEKQQAIPD
ncbi:conserved hypothetical protein [Ricinus communis]|uniref:Uncharacterized protein n=1 Tax=Ricinus communis TaxID=3988 RepID=B9TC94_RICCO|nr:conserved hypothetical protein [Ricinus communis]